MKTHYVSIRFLWFFVSGVLTVMFVLGLTPGQGSAFTQNITKTFTSAGAQDGWVLESGEFSNTGGSLNAAATTFKIGDDLANKQYRTILSFDTSSLPDDAVISKAVLKIKKQGLVGTNPFSTLQNIAVDVRRGAFSNNAALQKQDFQALPGKAAAAIIKNVPASNWYSAYIFQSGLAFINRRGKTQFRLRFQKDDNNNKKADFLLFYSGNSTLYKPQLVVTYSLPPQLSCGQTITTDTVLTQNLACPAGTDSAIIIGASNITLDLGGHRLSGFAPGNGVFAIGQEGITIKNGTIDGFTYGVFVIDTHLVTLDNLTIRNLDISDPNQFIFGINILSSQDVVVKDSLFEFLSVPHKEAVEVFDSTVAVSNIEVHGGGAGVSFSFANGACDPLNSPSNGTVLNSRFYNIYIAGIWVACTSSVWIEGNDFYPAPETGIGIQGDAPFDGAVTGLTIKDNTIHDTAIGIEFRGITNSTISNNLINNNRIWGIALRQSLGCLTPEPGWECFYSTANTIADNQVLGNGMDLFHDEESSGNIWERNICETTQGADIPACLPPPSLP